MEMESKNRRTWIIVAAILVAVVACCCAVVAAALAGGLLWVAPLQRVEVGGDGGKRAVQSYQVGQAPTLAIDSFSGSIAVRAGEAGTIEVVAHKQGRSQADLERIQVDITKQGDGLVIKTTKPPGVSSAWVQFEITAPAGTRLDARTGSGSIQVEGLSGGVRVGSGSGGIAVRDALGDVDAETSSGAVEVRGVRGRVQVRSGSGGLQLHGIVGEIDAHTGSGAIEARGASGPVRLDTGSGGIDYEGLPQGACRFTTGSGSISLMLPADLQMAVDLQTGSGRIIVDYEVAGRVNASKTEVKGVIGSGEDGQITASTGSGSIRVTHR
jgi:DUF4097 and DUF4098 domain-containing protein YvlB